MGEKRKTRIGYNIPDVSDMETERYGNESARGVQSATEEEHIERKRIQDAKDEAGAAAAGVAVEEWRHALSMETKE